MCLSHSSASATALRSAIGEWFIVERNTGRVVRGWIEHCFQQTADGRDLTGSQPVYQFVNVLLLVGGIPWHAGIEPSTYSTAAGRNADAAIR